jgi:tetratricopeptide (TPR) repeat protein
LYYYRGLNQLNHEEYDRAIQDFLKAVELNLESAKLPFAYFHLGNSFRELGQPLKAFQYYSEAIKKLPNDDVFLFWRAVTLLGIGRYAEAAADLDRAAKIDPFDEHIRIERAHLAAALGKKDEATQLLKAAREQAEVLPSQLLTLAEAYLVVDPHETINLLESNPDAVKESRTIASFLKVFAATLLDMDEVAKENLAILQESGKKLSEEGWYVTELAEFLKWGKAQGQLSDAQHSILSKLVSDSR